MNACRDIKAPAATTTDWNTTQHTQNSPSVCRFTPAFPKLQTTNQRRTPDRQHWGECDVSCNKWLRSWECLFHPFTARPLLLILIMTGCRAAGNFQQRKRQQEKKQKRWHSEEAGCGPAEPRFETELKYVLPTGAMSVISGSKCTGQWYRAGGDTDDTENTVDVSSYKAWEHVENLVLEIMQMSTF